jgi:hypothetical protein
MANPDAAPATATATTIAQQLGTARGALQQVMIDYATVQFTRPERNGSTMTSSHCEASSTACEAPSPVRPALEHAGGTASLDLMVLR